MPALISYVPLTPKEVPQLTIIQQFVATSKFTETIPCFNVTSDEFQTKDEVELEKKVDGKESGAGRLLAGAGAAIVGTIVAALMM